MVTHIGTTGFVKPIENVTNDERELATRLILLELEMDEVLAVPGVRELVSDYYQDMLESEIREMRGMKEDPT